ncbi:MAG: hypothetical protein WAZ14_04650 [Patescibacteria group bacterium]
MAQIYFGMSDLSVTLNETFEVGVFLDTHGQTVAAIESKINLPEGFRLINIRDGNSAVSLWIERPHAAAGGVEFSGAIPGGYSGDRAELFVLVLQANSLGVANLSAEDTRILLSDGLGSDAEVVPGPLQFTVVSEGEVGEYTAPLDTEPPEIFTPVLGSPAEFDQWAVIFSAQDKGSGIDRYEVKEGQGGWVTANSPHVLIDQNLRRVVRVKAIDKAGNERVVQMVGTAEHEWYEGYQFWGILGLVFLGVVGVIFLRHLWAKKLHRGRRG